MQRLGVGAEMDDVAAVKESFDRFFVDEFPAIARAAWFVVFDTELAKEIAQEAFCRALQRWDRVSGYERPGAWVRTVAVRLAVRTRQRRRREASWTEVEAVGVAEAPSMSADLESALRRLPRQQRAAVVLHYLCDLDTNEVAAALRCRPATARVHLHRGRAALGRMMEVKDDEQAR